jgi:hypothetical protein
MVRPTGVKSNMPKGWPSSSARMRETMMLGEVPTSVISPPSSEPKAIGMRRLDTGVPLRRATWSAIGMKIARAPMFLTIADRKVTAPVSTTTCAQGVVMRALSGRIRDSTTPERPIPALTTRAEPTMMTMSSEKPWKASFGLTMPTATEASRASSPTRS